jgi:hypothetical protein
MYAKGVVIPMIKVKSSNFPRFIFFFEGVWECGCGYFSKYFSLRKVC